MNEILAGVFGALSVPVLVCDHAGRVVLANRAADRLLGADEGALVGAALIDLVPPSNRRIDDQPLDEALRARATRGGHGPHRMSLMRPDALEIEVECTATLTGAILVLSLAVIRDEAEARGRPGSYQLIFEHAPLGIFHFDERGVITACNENFVQIIGSTREMLIGLNMLTLPDQDLVGTLRAALAGTVSGYEGDYRSATASKVTPVSVLFAPIVEDGRITGGVGIVRDDTERKAAMARLAQADRLASLGTLAAGVAHEINNPLTYVLASLQAALRRVSRAELADGRIEDWLTTAVEGAERLRRIVHDLRMFSRLDERPRTAVDAHAVLDAAINLCWGEVKHRAELTRDYGDVPPVLADEVRLGQVFVNLIINAAHALPAEGRPDARIWIRTRATEEHRVLVEVSDNGEGIAPELLPRVFEPFVTSKPLGVGTGLGLSICHGIVTGLGGEIAIDSVPGRGTTMRVQLPVAAGTQPVADVPEPPPATRGSARILVVDDERRLLKALEEQLSERHQVRCASSGSEALQLLLEDASFDLVLCDVMMPGVNGLELYEATRRLRPRAADRFVFMTGGVLSRETYDELVATGVPRLDKPFDISDVEALLAPGDQR